jgi:hypothetical protein
MLSAAAAAAATKLERFVGLDLVSCQGEGRRPMLSAAAAAAAARACVFFCHHKLHAPSPVASHDAQVREGPGAAQGADLSSFVHACAALGPGAASCPSSSSRVHGGAATGAHAVGHAREQWASMERVARHSVSHGAQSPDERLPREKGRQAPFLLAGVQGQRPAGVQGQRPAGGQGQRPAGVQGQRPAGGAGAAPRSLPTRDPTMPDPFLGAALPPRNPTLTERTRRSSPTAGRSPRRRPRPRRRRRCGGSWSARS